MEVAGQGMGVSSLFYRVGLGNQTQIIRHGGKCLSQLGHLSNPSLLFSLPLPLSKDLLFLFYGYVCFAYMYAYAPCVKSLWRSEEVVGFPGAGVSNGCELPRGCWDLHLGTRSSRRATINLKG